MGAVPLEIAGDAGPGSERPPGEPRLVGYLYLLPAFAVFFCFVLLPLGHAGWISLWDWDGLTTATWAGLGNYGEVFTDEELRSAFVHALILLIFYAVLPLAIGLLLAGVMARARVRGLALFRTILFLPQVIAMVVVAVMWKMVYDPENGSLNRFLGWFGIEGKSWLGDFNPRAAVGRADRHVGLLRAGDGAAERGRAEDPWVAVRRGAGGRRRGVPGVPGGDAAGAARRDRGRADADNHVRPAQLRPRLHHDQRRAGRRDHGARLPGLHARVRVGPGRGPRPLSGSR